VDNDDVLIGRVLNRREALKLLAVSGAAALTGCQRPDSGNVDSGAMIANTTAETGTPACVVRPELTVGPDHLVVDA